MIALVLRHELRTLARDGRFLVLALVLLCVLAGTLAASLRAQQRAAADKAQVSAAIRAQWDGQGAKHPHRGAHFGLYALRPDAPLAAFDPGLLPYAGQAIWLEPHRRNTTRFRPAADEPPSTRFGSLTPAFVLVALLPLLVIACAFHGVSDERERGTLRMAQGLGVSASALLAGKLLAVLLAVGGLAALACAAGLAPGQPGVDANALARGALLAVAAMLYLLVVAAVVLAVSSLAHHSRQSLFVLLGLWVAFVFVVPRIGAAAAVQGVPLPAPEAFWGAIERDYKQGLQGDGDLAARGRRVDAALLREHGAARIEDLPLGVAAARRLARDAYADRVHALHFDDLWRRYERQENIARLAALLSPSVAMRAFAMKMAGTDLAHQRHFEDAAERYRQSVNTAIDRWDLEHTRGLRSFEDRYADNGLWQSIAPLRYTVPDAAFAWRAAWPEALCLLAWALGALALLRAAARRLAP